MGKIVEKLTQTNCDNCGSVLTSGAINRAQQNAKKYHVPINQVAVICRDCERERDAIAWKGQSEEDLDHYIEW